MDAAHYIYQLIQMHMFIQLIHQQAAHSQLIALSNLIATHLQLAIKIQIALH